MVVTASQAPLNNADDLSTTKWSVFSNPTSHILGFPVLDDPLAEDTTLPAFMVSTSRGFLPRADPLVPLPPEFSALESLLERMPIQTASGSPGLLATGSLGSEIDNNVLPNLAAHIPKYKHNHYVLNALYRDYSFIASAYLLEPCHMRWLEGQRYGLGRQELPECISIPIAEVAKLTGFQPFMEYAGSYALYNYKLIDPSKPLAYDNLNLIRAFESGLDRSSSEAGFVLVHVDMVKESGGLVKGALQVLQGCENGDRDNLRTGLDGMLVALRRVNKAMDGMWKKSKPGDYNGFRTFIFGITSQSMFPNGVLYRGVSSTPLNFRGESGANDSMIPLVDNLFQIRMPDTPLTEILRDFRKYRPGNHRQFLEHVYARSEALGVQEHCLDHTDPEATVKYLLCLDQVREFRWRHWCFTREYILKKTNHPTATGGSPIVTWLPNQLGAVLALMRQVLMRLDEWSVNSAEVEKVREVVDRQSDRLAKEVEKYCRERGVEHGEL
ncbi:hypothetical protein BDZ91DRAFT_831741 [Kalaharituber pfeilii]|nr:hypothetical protein BDZ91DRAFT_831741 [Kalaharituber pfeilii]